MKNRRSALAWGSMKFRIQPECAPGKKRPTKSAWPQARSISASLIPGRSGSQDREPVQGATAMDLSRACACLDKLVNNSETA